MTVQTTHDLDRAALSQFQNDQVYNGLDCLVTYEIWENLEQKFSNHATRPVYSFERALQAPYLDIMLRGFNVDQAARYQASETLRSGINQLRGILDEFAIAVWGKPLNPNSPKQLQEFFYRSMNLPEVWLSQKGIKKLSTNREALEKLDAYIFARPFINCILEIRDLKKQLDVFETEIDPDGRWRTSYNIGGTETGRPSSSASAFGTGGNAQNIAGGLRFVFTADVDHILCVIDLEQVEARDVGFFEGCLFDDWSFLNNCEGGDLHTNNAKLVWPELPWNGDPKHDRAIADRLFYRDFSYRDMAKRGSHLSNYSGSAWTMARSLKIPLGVAEEFQLRYCRGTNCAFPAHQRWWQWTAEQLQTKREITTPFGRTRQFFSRQWEDSTLREAIAFLPQSTTADRMNLGLLRVYEKMGDRIGLLAQTYDSITFQFHQSRDRDSIIQEALELIRVELVAPNGRSYVVPGEAKIGYNWGSQITVEDQAKMLSLGREPPRLNPHGLRKWRPGMALEQRPSALSSALSALTR
jgi:DNA polymerase I